MLTLNRYFVKEKYPSMEVISVQKDPISRLADAERLIQALTQKCNALVQENSSIKARIKAVEVECGMYTDGSDDDGGEGIG